MHPRVVASHKPDSNMCKTFSINYRVIQPERKSMATDVTSHINKIVMADNNGCMEQAIIAYCNTQSFIDVAIHNKMIEVAGNNRNMEWVEIAYCKAVTTGVANEETHLNMIEAAGNNKCPEQAEIAYSNAWRSGNMSLRINRSIALVRKAADAARKEQAFLSRTKISSHSLMKPASESKTDDKQSGLHSSTFKTKETAVLLDDARHAPQAFSFFSKMPWDVNVRTVTCTNSSVSKDTFKLF